MSHIQIHISSIKEQLLEIISHPYLMKHIEFPVIDEDKLLLLYSALEPIELSNEKKEQYILSTMLVQIALDTHDLVTNAKLDKMKTDNSKNRQLTVLAGDYYSGLHYRLLAYVDDIKMIKTLANSIKQVNEHKIAYYQKDFDGMDNLMDSIGKIESSLVYSVSQFFSDSTFKELTVNFLLLKRLISERKKFSVHKSSFLFDALTIISFSKSQLGKLEPSLDQEKHMLFLIDRYIEHIRKTIDQLATSVPNMNELLKTRIQELLYEVSFTTNTFVEEG
ncbi:heptaprenyl diphosphate synthase component 1 [Sutcliffiella deserti]|uniref:heptaprenyl diphosphate synthase component 1 n=1 Tax=Sutcliffiella deserti TaxID=2875501 RepID=UPI001CBAE7D6|nr:heptaprenyl diphosphate synthase component 1 [Sutcliffiella deserti]